MKKTTLLLLLIAVFMLAACSSQGVGTGAESTVSDSAESEASEEGTVALVEKPQSYDLGLKAGIDGKVSFEEDTSNSTVLEFLADGQEKTAVLEDGNGLVWKLTVPANALAGRQQIEVTAMKNINSSLGELYGGVILKPDGLRFLESVTLSVSGKGVESSGFAFSGNGSGDRLEFSELKRNQGSIDMKLYHFSTAYADPMSEKTIKDMADMADEQRKSAEAAAQKLLKQPIEAPYPPSISLKCHHETEAQDEAVLKQFLEEFSQPEMEVLNALLSAARSSELLTGQLPDQDFKLELRLVSRLMKKANALINEYKGQEEKYIAVSRAALETERKYQLLAGSGGENSLIPKLSEWAKEIAVKYLQELKDKHEYKNLHPILKIAREAALLGADIDQLINEDLRNALRFKVEYSNNMNTGRDWGFAFEVMGEAELDFSLVLQQPVIEGAGTGTYKNFQVNGLEDGTAVMENISQTFPIRFTVEGFNPCQSDTFTISMDRFGAESETVTLTPDDPEIPPKTVSGGAVQGGTEYSFQDLKQENMCKFTVDLKNGSVNAADQTFTRDNDRVAVELNLKLIHTP